MTDAFAPLFEAIHEPGTPPDRPRITLSYAQSVDGSLALVREEALNLSSPEAWEMTHRLRAAHDGILVGIGTVLADDPELTVRLAPGPQPQPIVLDTHLRMPLDAACLRHPNRVWIATSVPKSNSRSAALDSAEIITLPTDVNGRVHLAALLKQLTVRGVRTLMVEGGPETIASFLRQRAADLLVVTIAPTLIQGLTLPRNASAIRSASGPRLEQPTWIQAGPDMVLWSRLAWEVQ